MKVKDDPRAKRDFGFFLQTRGYDKLSAPERDRLWEAFAWAWVPEQPEITIVLQGPPMTPEGGGRFVEVVDAKGHSIKAGHWREDDHGYWRLDVAGSRGAGAPSDAATS